VQRGNELNAKAGLSKIAKSVQADFLKLPFEANSFDGVYAIEATCHAPRREDVYGEIFRVLKPGQVSPVNCRSFYASIVVFCVQVYVCVCGVCCC
jgi:ubiquinone/menaquinone biosynthesis C-methylase UbiE